MYKSRKNVKQTAQLINFQFILFNFDICLEGKVPDGLYIFSYVQTAV